MAPARRGVKRLVVCAQDPAPLLGRVHGGRVYSVNTQVRTLDEIQEASAIRQELRKPVGRFVPRGIGLDDPRGHATRSGHAIEAALSREQDQSMLVPGAASGSGRFGFAQDSRRAPVEGDPLQLVFRKECKRLAVGGPEREIAALGAGQLAGVQGIDRPRSLNSFRITAKWRHGSRPPAPSQSSNRRPWFPRNRTEGLSTRGGAVPAVASPASVAAGGGIKAAICAACWPRQNAFESSGLVLRNPILLLSILAISGIACSVTSPASTPAATDFSRASCPDLKSRCLSGLRCRTSASPQPHKQTGFWNQEASAAALALRTSHARLAPSILLVFIANLRLN